MEWDFEAKTSWGIQDRDLAWGRYQVETHRGRRWD